MSAPKPQSKKTTGLRARSQAKSPSVEVAETYRFTERRIQKWTYILVGGLVGSIVFGLALAVVGASIGTPFLLLMDIGFGIAVGGPLLMLMIAAILGGGALLRGGGVLGFLLGAGFISVVAAQSEALASLLPPKWVPLALWGGWGLMALSIVGFWVIGWITKVPMWLQTGPFSGPGRIYQRRSIDGPDDAVLPNELNAKSADEHVE